MEYTQAAAAALEVPVAASGQPTAWLDNLLPNVVNSLDVGGMLNKAGERAIDLIFLNNLPNNASALAPTVMPASNGPTGSPQVDYSLAKTDANATVTAPESQEVKAQSERRMFTIGIVATGVVALAALFMVSRRR